MENECSVPECKRKAVCKGMCDKHYRHNKNHGYPVAKGKKVISPRACHICGKIFTPSRKSDNAKYCSKSCIGKTESNIVHCQRIATLNLEMRASKLRGKGEGKTYLKYMGRHLHRVIAEQLSGRKLGFTDVVHHIDGNKFNNEPSNLVVTTRKTHMSLHGMGIPGVGRPRRKSTC